MPEQLEIGAERKIPRLEGFLFFYPLQQICVLLNLARALMHGYEEARQSSAERWQSWPIFRTWAAVSILLG